MGALGDEVCSVATPMAKRSRLQILDSNKNPIMSPNGWAMTSPKWMKGGTLEEIIATVKQYMGPYLQIKQSNSERGPTYIAQTCHGLDAEGRLWSDPTNIILARFKLLQHHSVRKHAPHVLVYSML